MLPVSARGPLISVVIPTLDRLRLLDQALASVAAQTYRPVEAVVVNDGGVPVTEVCRQWQRQLPITLVELERTRGISAARNAGLDAAQGRWLAFLDDDDVFLPCHLELAAGALRAGAGFTYLGAIVTSTRTPGPLTTPPPGEHLKAYPWDPDMLLLANYIHTGSVVVDDFRSSRVRFDETMNHCEDWDMWLALTKTLDYPAVFIPKMTSVYHQPVDGAGLVTQAQLTVPSPFSVVREQMHRRWPTDDPAVLEYRAWFTAFEDFRNQLITERRPIPHQLFDTVLGAVYERFTRGLPPDYASIPGLFGATSPARER